MRGLLGDDAAQAQSGGINRLARVVDPPGARIEDMEDEYVVLAVAEMLQPGEHAIGIVDEVNEVEL